MGASSKKRKLPQAKDFNVAWICALPLELAAAIILFDDEYDELDEDLSTLSGGDVSYTFGRMGDHFCVVACLPSGCYGTTSAATVAIHLNRDFPWIHIRLMVGIGQAGGYPDKADIHLGDVVIGQPVERHGGVVQYDMGKTMPDGKKLITGFLNRPPDSILCALSKLRAKIFNEVSNVAKTLAEPRIQERYGRALAGPDVLYDQQGNINTDRGDRNELKIHCGTIASGNSVIEDAATRDSLSEELGGVMCFEMEAAGLMNNYPCLVIRGICDYADSHRNKSWQPHAAIAAAACAKEFLLYVHAPKGRAVSEELRDNRLNNMISSSQQGFRAFRSLSEEKRKQLFQKLSFDTMGRRQAAIREALKQTCQWFLEQREYLDWLDDNKHSAHQGLLYVMGKPAVGKSTLMKFLYEQMESQRSGAIIISFFFNARGEDLEKSTAGLYRSFLYQLLKGIPRLLPLIDGIGHTDEITRENYDLITIQNVISKAIYCLEEESVICFIDALDECGEEEVNDMIEFFEDILEDAPPGKLKICFSKRHYPNIIIIHGLQLCLEEQEGHERDISRYVNDVLGVSRGRENKKTTKIKKKILERAKGIFLWVVLVVGLLKKEIGRGRTHALEKCLDEIPNELEQLFQAILTLDSENMDQVIICLQWALYSKGALKRKELYYAILSGVYPDALQPWDPEEITTLNMDDFILDSSKGLVEIKKGKEPIIQFIHESVREFFRNGNDLARLQLTDANISVAQSHEKLKNCCLQYMEMGPFILTSTPMPPLMDSYMEGKELKENIVTSYPFLEYAMHGVLHHADKAQENGISQRRFLEVFPLHTWVKLKNILEQFEARRHTPSLTWASILAENHMLNLLDLVTHDPATSTPELTQNCTGTHDHVSTTKVKERYKNPLVAAASNGNQEAVATRGQKWVLRQP